MNNMKNIAKILCFVLSLVLVFSVIGVSAFAEEATPVEVATYDELVAALANGGNIQLSGDITTTAAIVTSGVTATIDLNGKTLTIGAGDNKFNDESNITFKNGNICITDVTVSGNAIFCIDEYEETLVSSLTLENVNLVGDGYSSAYGIFYIGDSSELNVKGGEWSLKNDTFSAGGVFKADDPKATLKISGLNLEAHNVRRLVTYAATVVENSTIAISGDADGIDAEMEHGFNRSPLTITNSTVTMKNMVGRGITAECGAVNITNSTVTMSNVQEASIDVRNAQTVTVDDESTVALDKAPTVADGCTIAVEGAVEGAVEYGTLNAVYASGNRYWGECGGSAGESFEFYFYSDDTYMGKASLNNINGIIDGDVYVTWSLSLNGVPSTTSYWSNEWYINPSIYMQPNRVVQVVDGVEVAEENIQLNAPDDLNKIVAISADADGYLTAFHTTLSAALEAEAPMVLVLRDVTENIPAFENVTLVSGVDGGVTINNTATGVVDFDNVTLYSGVTLNVANLYSGDSENSISGTLNVSGKYEHSYNAYTYIDGKVTVGELVITNNDSADAGINISVWSDDDSAVALSATTLTIDSGKLSAYGAVIKCDNFVASGSATFGSGSIFADNCDIDADLDYKAQVNADGSFTMVKKVYTVEVNGKKYETLQEAVDAAGEGDTVVILSNIEEVVLPTADTTSNADNCLVYIAADKKVTLDLNGYTISVKGDDASQYDTLVIRNNGDLTITDTSADKNGKITLAYDGTQESGNSQIHSTILNFGTLTIDAGTIENTATSGKSRYAVYNYSWGGNAILTVKGGTLTSKSCAIFSSAYDDFQKYVCNVIIEGGELNGGVWYSDTGYSAGSKIAISGGVFNEGVNPALTIKGLETTVISVTGGEFNGNVSFADGIPGFISGGIYTVDVDAYCAVGYKTVKKTDGTYGIAPASATPEIIDGYWYIGGVNTGAIAVPSITINEDGYWCINGQVTLVRAEAENGHNPEISVGEDGYWYIDDVKTETKAVAVDGVGIKNIVKQESDGSNVDVYLIYFTDENLPPIPFTVTNGIDGDQGEPGLPGAEGPKGDQGDQGAPGEDGYDGNDVVITAVIATAVCTLITITVLGIRVFKRDPFALRF